MIEQEIILQLNINRPPIHRPYRLVITCEGQARLIYQQDKRDYFLNDCVFGKISMEPNRAQLKTLSLFLVRKDEYRLAQGAQIKRLDEIVCYIDMNKDLKRLKEGEGSIFISFLNAKLYK